MTAPAAASSASLMRRLRNKRRWASWMAVIALLGNVLAGALGHGAARAAADLDDMFGAHLMCTGGADATQPQAPSGGQDSDGKPSHCVICTLLVGFGLAVALVFAAIAFPATYIFHPLRFDLATIAEHLNLGGIRSRAPPLSALKARKSRPCPL